MREPNGMDGLIGARIRERRQAAGLTQGAFAMALGISSQQVQKYESGANRVAASRLAAIAQVLETPIGVFYEGEVTASEEPLIYAVLSAPHAAEWLMAVEAAPVTVGIFLMEHAGRVIQTLPRSQAVRLFQNHHAGAAA